MRRTTVSDLVLGIPFHFRSWSKMNQMKRDVMSLDRLPNRVRCLSAGLSWYWESPVSDQFSWRQKNAYHTAVDRSRTWQAEFVVTPQREEGRDEMERRVSVICHDGSRVTV